jgi:peptidoglycan DL-endopeptidase LytE
MKRGYFLVLVLILFFMNPLRALGDTVYEVKKGDSLYKISKLLKVNVEKIKEANSLDSIRLNPGTKLNIPGKGSPPTTVSPGKAVPATAIQAPLPSGKEKDSREISYHVIKKGETLASIAKKYSISVKELKELNQIRDTRRLRLETRLLVRQEKPKTYVVRNGDTIWKIAKRFGLKAEDLVDLNELEPDEIKPGQEILLRPDVDETDATRTSRVVSDSKIVEDLKELSASAGESAPGMKDQLLLIARRMINIPYMLGGNTYWGIDCSAYVQKVFGLVNISLPRTAREQFRVGEKVHKENLSIGDLVFFRTYATFPSHVGIYLGQDQFIHASSFARKVRIDRIDKPYFVKRFIGAKRLALECPPVEQVEHKIADER